MKEYLTRSNISYFSIGSGTPIIFLHGLSLDKQSTCLFFEPLSNAGQYQRIYLDLPGMGNSDPISPSTSDNVLETLIEAIEEIIGARRFILYGHSYGGYLAQAIAFHLKDQTLGVFLTCPVITADHSKRLTGKHINIFEEDINPVENKEYFADFLSMNVIINNQAWHDYQNLIIPGLQKEDKTFIDRLQNNYSFTFEEKLKNINYQFPFKIMVGRNDQVVGYQEQLKLINHNENGEIVLLNRTGHNLMIDQREAVGFHFDLFLDELNSNN
ncbi:alpha/beta hydrolase [Oenococcus oeni]|uniref:Prolyl aminopeptidase n=1 Tax=Oenococcus oeni TaxID=1247 RepID=A0AAQ2UWW6_OENOE|nr:alpha/beta hydrolase [Oenococcus oeni]OIL37179.1 alpha/beta hydrolase [Oenococcus oeni]OIM23446.1 alpha/beta hydrolase [Oenococcus oeni]OLQ38144.1 alpha/beta hydrolase [Oenococcus oeni]SYW06931.1 putative Prolyl aminopeptidase [Oenococcus oeni]VDB99369.1 putative Prolyl aminopeptidase [Oenococcus oeni]